MNILVSIAEARSLARRAKQAWLELAEFDQPRIDAIVDAMAAAATQHADAFARMAGEETGYRVVADKIQKNLFSSQKVYGFIRRTKRRSSRRTKLSAISTTWGPGP